jgi:hypothetical protein
MQANEVAASRHVVAGPIRSLAKAGRVAPAAAPVYAVGATEEKILAQLPDIAVHVVNAQHVGGIRAYSGRAFEFRFGKTGKNVIIVRLLDD